MNSCDVGVGLSLISRTEGDSSKSKNDKKRKSPLTIFHYDNGDFNWSSLLLYVVIYLAISYLSRLVFPDSHSVKERATSNITKLKDQIDKGKKIKQGSTK